MAGSNWKPLALALTVIAAQAGAAAPSLYLAHMTGTELVRDMQADPADSQLNSVRRERAMGYISGVMDAAAGSRWCPSGKPVPHELNYVVIEEISAQAPDKLKGSAAVLVLNTLARLYPCAQKGAKP